MCTYSTIEELCDEVQRSGFDLNYIQLGKGKYAASFPNEAHGRSLFASESSSVPIAVQGSMDENTCMLTSGMMTEGGGVSFNGQPARENQLVVFFPGSELYVTTNETAAEIAQMCLPAKVLSGFMNASELDEPMQPSYGPFRISVPAETVRWFDESVRYLALSRDRDGDLALRLEEYVLLCLMEHAKPNWNPHEGKGKGRPVEYYDKTFKLAADYIDANLSTRLELDEICKKLQISLRTLQRVFVRRTGVSPRKYIQISKLNAIRSELQDANYPEQTVSEVALKYEMNHLGRFSSSYHSLFGEYPSETLMTQ